MITIDVRDMLKEIKVFTDSRMEIITDVMAGAAEKARDMIAQRAEQKLSVQNCETYTNALMPTRVVGPGHIEIVLQGDGGKGYDLANMFEQGFPGFDMKPGLLKGKPYVNVPFDWLKEGSARAPSKTVQPLAQQASKSLDQAIAKAKRITGPGGVYEARAGKFRADPNTRNWKTAPSSQARVVGVKSLTKGGKGAQSAPRTWRRVSAKSPDYAWWHKGLPGIKAFAEVAEEIKPILEKALKDALVGR
jgi:hypothetical protein